jgi:hypothetical protein
MHDVYRPDLWHELYVMLGTSAATLIGLLFVTSSLHLNEIARNEVYHIRAYNQTRNLVLLLVVVIAVLVPQPTAALGLELMLLNIGSLLFPVRSIYNFVYKSAGAGSRGDWALTRAYG